MLRRRLQLRDLARLLPWLGICLLVGSIIVLLRYQRPGSFPPFMHPEERRILSGWFDTVVIDPGHGGQDEGASSHNLKEKVVTLDLGKRLAQELRKLGFKTLLTRDADVYVSLLDRVTFANAVQNAVFVSLHCNYTSDSNAKGIEIYRCSQKSGESKTIVTVSESEEPLDRVEERLAQCINDSAVQTMHAGVRDFKRANFFVVRNVNYPAVLVESGFLTNSDEAGRLGSPVYRQELAGSIATGIAAYRSLVCEDGVQSVNNARPNTRPISVSTGSPP